MARVEPQSPPGISKTHATVEDSSAGLGQTLRMGRPLVGGLFFHGVLGLCMSSLALRLPGGIQGSGHERGADACLGLLLWRSDNCLRSARSRWVS